MYRCLDCGAEFDEPQSWRERTGVQTDDGYQEIIRVAVCPRCHGPEYVTIVMCRVCGTYYLAGQGCPVCREKVIGKFRAFLNTLDSNERSELDELLDGRSVEEV